MKPASTTQVGSTGRRQVGHRLSQRPVERIPVGKGAVIDTAGREPLLGSPAQAGSVGAIADHACDLAVQRAVGMRLHQ